MQCRITNHIEGRAKYLVNYTICEMIEKIRLPFCMFPTYNLPLKRSPMNQFQLLKFAEMV